MRCGNCDKTDGLCYTSMPPQVRCTVSGEYHGYDDQCNITRGEKAMREILFRGKRIDNSEWVEGNLAAYDLICPDYPEDTYNATGDYYGQTPYVGFVEVIPETVGQYTGLTDKNGKRIFEGDICKDSLGNCFVVEWEKESRFLGFTIESERRIVYINREPRVEIIGNIHDAPGLIGG